MNVKSLLVKFYLMLKEKKHKNRLRYLYEDNSSETLLVVFSGFPIKKPVYNYVRTLKDIRCNKLFILDDFGYKGSYYWYENGILLPYNLTKSLIANKLSIGGVKRLITLGSSKGGTCAIYYGLMFNATDIYAGACQYRVGTYLNTDEHLPIFKAMMGNEAGAKEQSALDAVMPQQLCKYRCMSSIIHLLYSKDEHTYQDDIQYLIKDLNENHINYDEKVVHFTEHGEVGTFFSSWIKNEINKLLNNG